MSCSDEFKAGVIEALRIFAASMEADYTMSPDDVDVCLRGAAIARLIQREGTAQTVATLRADAADLEREALKGRMKP